MTIVIKEYECPNCGLFEHAQQHTTQLKKCPTCKSKEIERMISAPIVAKDAAPKTVGSLIDRNNKRNPLTREKQFGEITEKKLDRGNKMQKIARMTPDQKRAYIDRGVGP
jgi:putative FmdB family regulatory protein